MQIHYIRVKTTKEEKEITVNLPTCKHDILTMLKENENFVIYAVQDKIKLIESNNARQYMKH